MAGITLKVSPRELKAKAEEIQNQIKGFQSSWEQASYVIQNTKGYWIGDAGNAHQKQFEQYKEDVERIIRRLQEHPEDLLKMADLYEQAEEQAVIKSEKLSGDIII